MSCVSTPQTLEGMIEMVESCAIAYGGSNWASLAMMGLAVVLVAGLLLVTLLGLLRAIR